MTERAMILGAWVEIGSVHRAISDPSAQPIKQKPRKSGEGAPLPANAGCDLAYLQMCRDHAVHEGGPKGRGCAS